MFWSFANINGKLAEIHFEKKNGKVKFLGHCYVKQSEYKTKSEKEAIKLDTAKVRLAYRKGVYKPSAPQHQIQT